MGQGFRDWIADERAEAKAEGVAEAVIDLLSGHGNVDEQLRKVIMKEKDLEILRAWLKTAAVVDTVEEFEAKTVIGIDLSKNDIIKM